MPEPTIKTKEEIEALRQGGKILARVRKGITILDKVLECAILFIAKIPAPASARR
ncbi:MAG: hypothetical protein Q8M83_03315 [bacterium]|nr:hypothetical protein [bacterium]